MMKQFLLASSAILRRIAKNHKNKFAIFECLLVNYLPQTPTKNQINLICYAPAELTERAKK